jgi:Family of unknown function (DUF5681)
MIMGHKRTSIPKTSRQETEPARKPGRTVDNASCAPQPSADPNLENEPRSFAVGYGRPPLHSRFKPGKSGNPKGRVKQSRNMRTIVQQVLNEDMQIREGGRVRRMSAMEALVRTTLTRSFKGDPKALVSLIVIMKQSGYGPDRDEPATDLLSGSDYEAIVADYLARNLSSNEADPEISTSNERSTPTASSTEPD